MYGNSLYTQLPAFAEIPAVVPPILVIFGKVSLIA